MKLNIDLKTIIIICLSIALLFCTDGCGYFKSKSGSTEVTTTTIDTSYTKEKHKSKPEDIKGQEVKQKVKIDSSGSVEKVEPDFELTKEQEASGDKVETVRKLNQTISLLNGTVFSEILFTGEILSSGYSLETNTPTLTKTVHTEKTIVSSGTFIYAGTSFGLSGGLKNVQAGVEYIHRNKWLIGGGLRYTTDLFIQTPMHNRLGFDVKIGFKL